MTGVSVNVHVTEFPKVGRASQLFMMLSLALQTNNKKACDEAITELERMRDFLERFTAIVKATKSASPVEVLNLVAKKQFNTLTQIMHAVFLCTVTAHILQQIHFGLLGSRPPQNQGSYRVDSSKLH
ncbi:hypothetical protein A3A36_02365 [Candidatus Kaiserbacteria bacterium RIFCSPLOWO2_01_FULL_52_12b]|uniref:Uncharacterized protein n=1 Tax=Candidatus Kaiserbacteria bacterium RIFCSPLOWO2_01_FULL_52_12b TaxID=1798509 RepID=A0A1F6EW97_9BACT|nr:MAG: hypothetical protein A3A36_02365 [Candidatus Kaiserbacteria bacterium RIFCSPLOWO2_01_FULL_52_12b]